MDDEVGVGAGRAPDGARLVLKPALPGQGRRNPGETAPLSGRSRWRPRRRGQLVASAPPSLTRSRVAGSIASIQTLCGLVTTRP